MFTALGFEQLSIGQVRPVAQKHDSAKVLED